MRARLSDEEWFEDLFRSLHARVRGYVWRRVTDNDIDDVVAEVFATAWRRRDQRARVDLPWLLRTASNLVMHQQRTDVRRTRLLERAASLDGASPDHADGVADRHDAHERVVGALALVSDLDREVLMLSVWDQLSSAEIGRVLAISSGAARVRLHRAAARLAAAATAAATMGVVAEETS